MTTPGPEPARVVFDANVLIVAAIWGGGQHGGPNMFRSWPSPPLTTDNPDADAVGLINDAAEFSLWLSPHILFNVAKVLAETFGWKQPQVDAYLAALVMMTEHSGGELVEDVPRRIHGEAPDHEDDLVLDLVQEVGALLLVTNDQEFLDMSPWRGRAFVTPRKFAALADGMRRHNRRRGRR